MYKAACLCVNLLLKLERKNKLPDAFVLSRSLDKNLHLIKKILFLNQTYVVST